MNFKEVGERLGNFPFCQVSHQILLLFIPLRVDFLELIAIYQRHTGHMYSNCKN